MDHLLLLFLTWSCYLQTSFLESSPWLATETIHWPIHSRNLGDPKACQDPWPFPLETHLRNSASSGSQTVVCMAITQWAVRHDCWTQLPEFLIEAPGWGLNICNPNKFPAMLMLLVPEPCFENHSIWDYRSPLLSMGAISQDPQWMPEIANITICTVCDFSCIKFHL